MKNISQFAKITGISKQAISKAIKNGLIPAAGKKGNSILIDPEDETVKYYINNQEPQRELQKKVSENNTVIKKPSKKVVKKISKNKKVIQKPAENFDDLTPVEINRRSKIAEMKKKERQVEILNKQYIPIEYLDYLFRYIEKLNSNMERSAGVFINEIGEKILEVGHVTPEHIESFVNLILETTHNTVKSMKKDIKKYEPKI